LIEDGRKAAADRAAKGEARPPKYHVATNLYVELADKSHARVHAYWQGVFESGGPTQPARVGSAGHELSSLVRVNGKC
jgi:TPR repeat protein